MEVRFSNPRSGETFIVDDNGFLPPDRRLSYQGEMILYFIIVTVWFAGCAYMFLNW